MEAIESRYPVLVISFQNCELHCCHLDGYKNNKEALLNRLELIKEYFSAKPRDRKYRIWYNIDDNSMSNDIVKMIVQNILNLKENIVKIAFIGADSKSKRCFKKLLGKDFFNKPMEYFKDAELAKEWLV